MCICVCTCVSESMLVYMSVCVRTHARACTCMHAWCILKTHQQKSRWRQLCLLSCISGPWDGHPLHCERDEGLRSIVNLLQVLSSNTASDHATNCHFNAMNMHVFMYMCSDEWINA